MIGNSGLDLRSSLPKDTGLPGSCVQAEDSGKLAQAQKQSLNGLQKAILLLL